MIQSNNSSKDQYPIQGYRVNKQWDEAQADKNYNLSISPKNRQHSKNGSDRVSSKKKQQQQQQQQQYEYKHDSRNELEEQTNSYLNEFTEQPILTYQRSSSIKNKQRSPLSSRQSNYMKYCSSSYVSRDISTPPESQQQSQQLQQSQQQSQQWSQEYSPNQDNSKERGSQRQRQRQSQIESPMTRSQRTISQEYSSQNQTPRREYNSRCGSSAKKDYQSPLRRQKYQASTEMALCNTEIVGSISCSTILNKSTHKQNGSILLTSSTKSTNNNNNNVIDEMRKKCTISRLGLSLKPVCSIHKHQQLKYICVDEQCIHKERVLCQLCVEAFQHKLHDVKTIEEYNLLLDSSYDTFLRKFFHFKSIKEELEHPSFLGSINQAINTIKSSICARLDGIKDKVSQVYNNYLKEMGNTNYESESSQFRSTSKGGRYSNGGGIQEFKDIKQSGGYLKNKDKNRLSKSMLSSTSLRGGVSALSSTSLSQGVSAEQYEQEGERMEEIGQFLEKIVGKNFFDLSKKEINMSLALVNRKHYVQLEELHESMQQKYSQLDSLFNDAINQYTNKLQLQFDNIFDNYSEFSVPFKQQSRMDKLQILQERQAEVEREMKMKRQELKQIRQEVEGQSALEKEKRLASVRVQHTFPYNSYHTNCYHLLQDRINCNTVPIFECCQQAYQCAQCHYKFCKHPPKITNPSKRYCMQCLSVFKVYFPTDVPINCDDCTNQSK